MSKLLCELKPERMVAADEFRSCFNQGAIQVERFYPPTNSVARFEYLDREPMIRQPPPSCQTCKSCSNDHNSFPGHSWEDVANRFQSQPESLIRLRDLAVRCFLPLNWVRPQSEASIQPRIKGSSHKETPASIWRTIRKAAATRLENTGEAMAPRRPGACKPNTPPRLETQWIR